MSLLLGDLTRRLLDEISLRFINKILDETSSCDPLPVSLEGRRRDARGRGGNRGARGGNKWEGTRMVGGPSMSYVIGKGSREDRTSGVRRGIWKELFRKKEVGHRCR